MVPDVGANETSGKKKKVNPSAVLKGVPAVPWLRAQL